MVKIGKTIIENYKTVPIEMALDTKIYCSRPRLHTLKRYEDMSHPINVIDVCMSSLYTLLMIMCIV